MDNHDLGIAERRMASYLTALERDGSRITGT
jgi:hypothetical protein